MFAKELMKFVHGISRMTMEDFTKMYNMIGETDQEIIDRKFHISHSDFVYWVNSVKEADLDMMIKYVNDGVRLPATPAEENFCIYERRRMTKGSGLETYKTPAKRPFTDYREMWFATKKEAKQFIKDNQRKLYNDRLCAELLIYDAKNNILYRVKKEA